MADGFMRLLLLPRSRRLISSRRAALAFLHWGNVSGFAAVSPLRHLSLKFGFAFTRKQAAYQCSSGYRFDGPQFPVMTMYRTLYNGASLKKMFDPQQR